MEQFLVINIDRSDHFNLIIIICPSSCVSLSRLKTNWWTTVRVNGRWSWISSDHVVKCFYFRSEGLPASNWFTTRQRQFQLHSYLTNKLYVLCLPWTFTPIKRDTDLICATIQTRLGKLLKCKVQKLFKVLLMQHCCECCQQFRQVNNSFMDGNFLCIIICVLLCNTYTSLLMMMLLT